MSENKNKQNLSSTTSGNFWENPIMSLPKSKVNNFQLNTLNQILDTGITLYISFPFIQYQIITHYTIILYYYTIYTIYTIST